MLSRSMYRTRSFIDSPSAESQDNRVLVSVIVLGASGALSKAKIFPALLKISQEGKALGLGSKTTIDCYGYARSKMTDEEFRDSLLEKLECRTAGEEECNHLIEQFLDHVHYHSGQYDSEEDMQPLIDIIAKRESEFDEIHRIFYLAVPPSIFSTAASVVASIGKVEGDPSATKLIVEKPHGRSLSSFVRLNDSFRSCWDEEQIWRIDHVIGKELVLNLATLRFANTVMESLWSRNYIEAVEIVYKETGLCKGRAGYFDSYGIIRDVVQNHLLTVLAFVAMEPPVSLMSNHFHAELLKVMKAIDPIDESLLETGQYEGYRSETGVQEGSRTPTFASTVVFINNWRWDGVPFVLAAGKGLDEDLVQVRIKFRYPPAQMALFGRWTEPNELRIRIQPEPAIEMLLSARRPGSIFQLRPVPLNLSFSSSFPDSHSLDAYERLLFDAIIDDPSLFLHAQFIAETWRIFDGVLKSTESGRIEPHIYKVGSSAPANGQRMLLRWYEERGNPKLHKSRE